MATLFITLSEMFSKEIMICFMNKYTTIMKGNSGKKKKIKQTRSLSVHWLKRKNKHNL